LFKQSWLRSLGVSVALAVMFAAAPSAHAQDTESVLVSFTGDAGADPGNQPYGNLIQASDGKFYGTTRAGGANDNGTVFTLTSTGTFNLLYSFSASGTTDGESPYAGLVQGTDGNFYGTTFGGGANDDGTVFKITSAGVLTLLHSFSATVDGSQPEAGLVQGTDGSFYGTTSGGTTTLGTVFKITSAGAFTLLHTFAGPEDGSIPYTGLVQGTDGNFYGTTSQASTLNGDGTLFKISPTSPYTVTQLLAFSGGTYGVNPSGTLVEGTDGNFYGTAYGGGVNNDGTVFSVTSAGTPTLLYSFCSQANCPNGEYPFGGLVLGSDGNFYGTASLGGASNNGTAFNITPAGNLTTLYSFAGGTTDGSGPVSNLVQGKDGNFYGTTYSGGADSLGTEFKLAISPALAAPVQLTGPFASIAAGESFTITYKVVNAYSDTLQQCFATNNAGDTTGWTGIFTGSPTAQIKSVKASTTPGTYTYTLTCGGMETGTLSVPVSKADPSTSLSSSLNPVTIGQNFVLSSTVTGSGATPTGTVNFLYGSTVLKTATLQSGTATDTIDAADITTIPPGSYVLTASYSGDSNNNASTSANYTLVLNMAPTSTTVTASPNPVTPPANCTLTATVTRSASGATGHATGTVTFMTGSTAIGTANLNSSGVAVFTAATGSVPAGSYPVTAKYNGDSYDIASTSTAVTVKVN